MLLVLPHPPSAHIRSSTLARGVLRMKRRFVIRPIRAEDEPLIARFHVRLSERSVYQRYFHFINIDQRISHDRLVRVCFGDYDGEIALVAERQAPGTGQPEILAVGAGARRGGMVWLGRRIRTRGFELATFLIAVAAAATAVMATLTGLQARATVSRDAPVADLMQEHLTNGVAADINGRSQYRIRSKESRELRWVRAKEQDMLPNTPVNVKNLAKYAIESHTRRK